MNVEGNYHKTPNEVDYLMPKYSVNVIPEVVNWVYTALYLNKILW